MTTEPRAVRPAVASDIEAITQILATGFASDPPLLWILPKADERTYLSPVFFRPFADMVLTEGHAFVTEDLSGAALWLDVDVDAKPADDADSFRQIFIDGLGTENAKRFFTLDDLFSANHPGHESHAYLLFVGVVPDRQNQGIGTALLSHRLAQLDRQARPAYLEASSERNAKLYSRLGFAPIGDPVTLPDGPTLHPMWRNPSMSHTAI